MTDDAVALSDGLHDRGHSLCHGLVGQRARPRVSRRLGIAQRTVEVYRARILEKMGVKTAVELAAMVAGRRR
ncbi:MAG TPA: LuxR C-terminal-related transcriptional regulator [Usitatibacter sp.]|nr:LuxR C-terminal-related transcriptional regulator [Usitatibacter sp.]